MGETKGQALMKRAVCSAWICLAASAFAGVSFENGLATMQFDEKGRLSSLVERKSGRELIAVPRPFVTVALTNGLERRAESVRVEGGKLVFGLSGTAGTVTFGVEPFAGGWTFTCEQLSVPAETVKNLTCFLLDVTCGKWSGGLSNVRSDENSGVCVRAYRCEQEMGRLWVRATPERGLVGWRAGLVAGPRERLLEALKEMTVVAGAPHSAAGGAWASDSPLARASYLFASCTKVHSTNLVEWVANMRRGALPTFHNLWLTFTGGQEDERRCIDLLHKAGFYASEHTYTLAITRKMPYVTPHASPDLLAVSRMILAKPIGAADNRMTLVGVAPKDWNLYDRSGTVLRIGTELVRFTAVERLADGSATVVSGIERGAYGTEVFEHAAGSPVDHLRLNYGCFYPVAGSRLAYERAAEVAGNFNAMGYDRIFMDGSEGPGSRYHADWLRRELATELTKGGRPIAIEASDYNAHSGWYHSSVGAEDTPTWSVKRFHDAHIQRTLRVRNAEFMAAQIGWWSLRSNPDWHCGPNQTPDETEYFASKAAANDFAVAIQGVSARPPESPESLWQEELLTILGWWERPRYAKAFAQGVLDKVRTPMSEWRLRQGDDGVWRIHAQTCLVHRVGYPDAREWKAVVGKGLARKAELTFWILRGMPAYDGGHPRTKPLLVVGDVPRVIVNAAKGVEASFAAGKDPVRGDVMVFSGRNENATSRGAWCQARLEFPLPGNPIEKGLGLWVRGDGSGAILNVQPEGRETRAYSEHYVKLDFNGWRYVTFNERERDAEARYFLEFPYPRQGHSVNNDPVRKLIAFNLWLNEIPAGGCAEVSVSEVRNLPEEKVKTVRPALSVNGRRLEIPFTVQGGEYVRFADGAWTHYDECGQALGRVRTGETVPIAEGVNSFSCEPVDFRTEVTVIGIGDGEKAFRDRFDGFTAEQMSYEAAEPILFAPKKGFTDLPKVVSRPGERVSYEIRVRGKAKNPVCSVAEDGQVRFTCDDADSCEARIDIVKRYAR